MNKTLLLVICDFLLLNLLALTRWEEAEPVRPMKAPVPQVSTGAQTKEQDLVETMRLSLADEQMAREQLSSELSAKEQNLVRVQTENSQLSRSLEDTQKKALDLDRKLNTTAQEAADTQARLQQLQRELDLKLAENNRKNEELDALKKAQDEARARIESLRISMGVAEQEKLLLRQTADTLKQQVEAERTERQKVQETTVQLAQGVGKLAESSGELTKEIRENRPINANVLFNDFLANRISVGVQAVRDNGFLGKAQRSSTTGCVFVSDGKACYALFHVDETPFGTKELAFAWEKMSVELSKAGSKTEAKTLHFLSLDPRIVAIPVEEAQIAALGAKIYPIALDPFKFPEAMLVNRGGSGYGETPFKLDPAQAAFVKMDNRFFKKLVGDFTPSRGDLVFSKSGEFLGIMVSSSYCAIVNNFLPARSITLGDTTSQPVEKILSEMSARVNSLPFRLQ